MSTVDTTFEEVLDRLVDSVDQTAEAMKVNGNAKWFVLGDAHSIINGFDHDRIAEAFSRDGTAKMYADAVEPGISYRRAQVAKVQGDILSAMERDVRMRTRSRVRMMAHASARQKTHSLGVGPIYGNILQYVRVLMNTGPKEDS